MVERNTLVGNRDEIAFREQERSTPRIGREGSVRIFNRDVDVRRNIVAYSPAYNVAMWVDTNFFGPHPGGGDRNAPIREDPAAQQIRFEENLVWSLPERPNYLYGVPWREKSRTFTSPQAFGTGSGIPVSDVAAEPRFRDVLGHDFHLEPGSPARRLMAGVRDPTRIPIAGW